jgi:ribosomal protein S17E
VQETSGNILEALGIDKDFLSRTQVAQKLREMIDKWDHEIKNFCRTKEMVSKLKSLPSYTSNNGLITRLYKELKKLNSSRINDSMKKWAKRTF